MGFVETHKNKTFANFNSEPDVGIWGWVILITVAAIIGVAIACAF
jgi:hypothetical protein